MPRSAKIAAIQMDAAPAPISERLLRAERLVRSAANCGAELVVLPELFNTGYGYTDENYHRAEPFIGPTVTWLKSTAVKYRIHLAGTLMLLDDQEIYNALLLFAPDGRMWRYDKNYPWGWERAYFRASKGITVAKTSLGDIGLLICWDTAHPQLWRRYAGQVDLMLISSCPPDVSSPTFTFPSGDRVTFDDFGIIGRRVKNTGRLLFGEMVNQQTAWLGVPAVQTVGTGRLNTAIPEALLSLAAYLPAATGLVRYIPQGRKMRLECDYIQGCKIVDGSGRVLTELEQAQGETFTVAEVTLADEKKQPDHAQPATLLPGVTYLLSDMLLPFLMVGAYRRGLRRIRSEK